MDHAAVTKIVAPNGYGVGVDPNPFSDQQAEWYRRKSFSAVRSMLTKKIDMLFEPRFITPPETSELIEAIVTASDSRMILEIGMCTGFTSLHILRAIAGKPGAMLVAVDARPAHDRAFFDRPIIKEQFEFIEGWTPQCLGQLHGRIFDLVFVDSDHSVEHTTKELDALWPITKEGTIFLFHDLPEWRVPTDRRPPEVRIWLEGKARTGTFPGVVVPTCEQLDCLDAWGPNYPKQCNPHLGIFIRR